MPRPLYAIPDGTAVMVDANIFVYAFTPRARFHQPCQELLERGALGAIRLYTTVAISADVIHRAMVLEVLSLGDEPKAARFGLDPVKGSVRPRR